MSAYLDFPPHGLQKGKVVMESLYKALAQGPDLYESQSIVKLSHLSPLYSLLFLKLMVSKDK
jgi:hypothetical protein